MWRRLLNQLNGIGGDLFAIIWNASEEKFYGLNGSGHSPKSLALDYFTSNGLTRIPASGPLPITVPGCVDAWFEMHEKFGKLTFGDLLAPTVQYGREGIAVAEEIAEMMDYLDRDLSRSYGLPDEFSWKDLSNFNVVHDCEKNYNLFALGVVQSY